MGECFRKGFRSSRLQLAGRPGSGGGPDPRAGRPAGMRTTLLWRPLHSTFDQPARPP
jgi:hypothetical protein